MRGMFSMAPKEGMEFRSAEGSTESKKTSQKRSTTQQGCQGSQGTAAHCESKSKENLPS